MTVTSTDQVNQHRKPTERRLCSYVKCLSIHSPSCALLRFLYPYLCLDCCFGGTQRKLRGLLRLRLIHLPTIWLTNSQLYSSWNNASHTHSELLLMQFICKIFHTKAEQRFQSQVPLGVQQKMKKSATGAVGAQLGAASTLLKAFRPNFSQRLCWSNKVHTTHDGHIWPEGNLLITPDIKLKLRAWKTCVIIKVWHTMHE